MNKILKPILVEREPYNYEDQYNEMLDEAYDEINIEGYSFNPSYVLKRLAPMKYNCELLDYINNLEELTEGYKCPLCGELFEEQHDATYCCQEYEEQ